MPLLHGCVLAGTLSGNPLAMTAGIKTLEILDRPGSYEHLDKVTSRLINGIMEAAKEAGHTICGGHISGEQPQPQQCLSAAMGSSCSNQQ
jgi:glutamate-1-semialdehyde aminotransferase